MKIIQNLSLAFIALASLTQLTSAKLKEGECEVCIKVVNDLIKIGKENKVSSMEDWNKQIKSHCATVKNRENRFCYYIGATEDAATKIINEVSKPLSFSMPAEKVCEKLKPKDAQICELVFEKQLDWSKIDLKKMRVKQLKKILNDWNEKCSGCLEKQDFIKRIEELKPKYVKEEL